MRLLRVQKEMCERERNQPFFWKTDRVSLEDICWEGAEKLAIPVDFGVCGGGGGVEVVDWRQYTTPFRRRPMHNLLRTEIYRIMDPCTGIG